MQRSKRFPTETVFPLLAALVIGALVACGPGAASAPSQPAAAPAGGGTTTQASADDPRWTEALEGARREGEVVVYGPPGTHYRDALVRPFESAYPGIKVTYSGATGADMGPRTMAERQAGRYIPDVHIGGTTTMNDTFKPAGALDPLAPLLIRPEVADTTKWFENQLWWADNEQQYNLMFEGGVTQIIAVNRQQVDPTSFGSYWDALDPKYRGKIVSSDIRRPGPGGGQSRFVWATEGLGPPYLEKLFGEMDVTLTEDRRQLTDWLAQGRFAVSVFPGSDEIQEAIKQGLPVALVDVRRLKEGFAVSAAFGSVAAMNRRPHPNATIVYLNWLLGPDGQLAWQRTGANSLRVDIPKDMVESFNVPPPGSKIFFASLEKYASLELTPIRQLISNAIENKR
jgi:ABC-type Fe3+ transport system substrate-binding protein